MTGHRPFELVCIWCNRRRGGEVFDGHVQLRRMTGWYLDVSRGGWLCPPCAAALPALERLKQEAKRSTNGQA